MSTNYYLTRPFDPFKLSITQNNLKEYIKQLDDLDKSTFLHIGLSSPSHIFQLHVIPELGLNNLDDWIELFNEGGVVIKNEYNQTITPKMMLYIIQSDVNKKRCDIDGHRVIGHDVYCDLVLGEFS